MLHIKGGETYPDYIFDETNPIPLGEVVADHHGLPNVTRSVDEIIADAKTQRHADITHAGSYARRHPKRYESRFVVDFLDELDDELTRISERVGLLALAHIQLLKSSPTPREK